MVVYKRGCMSGWLALGRTGDIVAARRALR